MNGRDARLAVGTCAGGLTAGLLIGLLAAERVVHALLAWRWSRTT